MTKGALGCAECAIAQGGIHPRGIPALARGAFVVHPRDEDAAVPGWMIIAPARHVEQWDALTARELRELGPLVGRVTAALRAETGAEKVYVNVFAEVLAHLHVHVIARTKDVPVEMRGPRVFLAGPASPATGDASRIGAAVLGRLASPAKRRTKKSAPR